MGKLRNYFLNHYPRTDFHELNQDWMISMLYDMINQVENFVEMNSVKYADPIQWDITRQYEKNTIVVDPITGTAYISSKPVPMGVALSRTEYWNVIFDLGRFITLASQNFANSYEAVLTTTATMPTDKDDWIVWNSLLYRAKNDIHVGDRYVEDGNIERYTVEMFFDELAHLISEETSARIEADTQLHNEVVAESVARENADTALEGDIDAEARAREEADDALQNNIDDEVTAREDADDALQVEIDTLNSDVDTLQSDLNSEVLARQAADTALSNRIDSIRSSVFPTIYDYGGTGDGSNQTAAFQAAINSGEEFILVPSGQYVIGRLDLSSLPASGGTVTFFVSPDANVSGEGADQLGIWSNNEFVIGIASNNTNRHRPLKIEHVTHSNSHDSVDAAVTVIDKVINSSDSLYHWGILQISDDYSTNPANQNVGIYQQFNRYAVGESCWGIAIECRDRINGISDETGGVRGMEISLSGVGAAPASGNRVGLHIICSDSDDQSQYQVNRGIYITAGGTRIGQAPDQNGFKSGIEMTSGYFEKGLYFHDMLLGYGIDFGNSSFIQAAIAIPHDTSIDFSNGFHVQYNSGIQALRFIQNSNDAYVKSNGLMHCTQMEIATSGGNVITFTNSHSTGSHSTVNHWITVKIDGNNFYMPLYD